MTVGSSGLHQFEQYTISVAPQTFIKRAAGARITVNVERIADANNVKAGFGSRLRYRIHCNTVQCSVVGTQITAVIDDSQNAAGLECVFTPASSVWALSGEAL